MRQISTHVARTGLILLLMLLPLLASCEHTERKILEPEPSPIEAEEYAVFSSLLEEWPLAWHSYDRIVVMDSTISDGLEWWTYNPDYLRENMPDLSDETLIDVGLRNDRNYALEDHFALDIPVEFLTEQESHEIFDGMDGWNKFYQRFPGSPGLFRFSRAGFNKAGDQALLYFAHSFGFLGAEGYAILMIKEDGNWTIGNSLMLWIS